MHRRSTDVEVRDAYYRLARRWHPDRKRGDAEKFMVISAAASAIRTERDREQRATRMATLRDECPICHGSGVTWGGGKGFAGKKAARCAHCGGEGYVLRRTR